MVHGLRRQIPERGRAANMAAERGAGQQQSQEMMEGERPLRATGERRAWAWAGTASCRIGARPPAIASDLCQLPTRLDGAERLRAREPLPEGGSGQGRPEPREQRGASPPRKGGRTRKRRLWEPSLKAPRLTGEEAGDCPLSAHWETEVSGVGTCQVHSCSRGIDGKESAREANGLWQSDGWQEGPEIVYEAVSCFLYVQSLGRTKFNFLPFFIVLNCVIIYIHTCIHTYILHMCMFCTQLLDT